MFFRQGENFESGGEKKILNMTEGGEFEALMLLEAKLTFHYQLLVSERNIFIVLRILIELEFST